MTNIVKSEAGLGMMDPTVFEQMQRVGKVLALSPLFPDHLRKGTIEQAIANGVLVINMAMRLKEDPLTIASNIYFVGGKPGWNTTYMISKANMHGVFKGPIDWDVTGAGADLSVTAFATLSGTDRRVQATCGMAMARAEGWVKNAKYQSMPEQMLRYRSAAFLIRLYCPEVMIGIPAAVEVEMSSMRDVTPSDGEEAAAATAEPTEAPKRRAAARPAAPATNDKPTEPEAEIVEAEVQAETEEKPAPREDPVEQHVEAATEEAPKADAAANPEAQQFDFREVYNSIMNDVLDGAPIAGVKEYWSDKGLDAMKSAAPDLYAKLEAEFSAAEG